MKKLLAFLFALIIAIILLNSCSSTNKHKTVSVTKTDSVSHVKTDSTGVKKKAQSAVRKSQTANSVKKNITNEKTTITVYDTVYIAGKQQVKYVIVKEKATDKTKSSIVRNLLDSSAATTTQQATVNKVADTDLHKVEKVKDKAVVTTKSPLKFLWWLLLLIPLGIWYFWKKIPSFLKFGL